MDRSPPGPSVHGFSRQEYWSGLPFPSPGDLPDPGIKPSFPTLQEDSLQTEPPGKPLSWGGGPNKPKGDAGFRQLLDFYQPLSFVHLVTYTAS